MEMKLKRIEQKNTLELFHKLWTKSVGKEEYNKDEWKQLEALLHNMMVEIQELENGIRYWSYCTWEGMLEWCSEKKNELKEWLSKVGIETYKEKGYK
jgi:hypothetical protein